LEWKIEGEATFWVADEYTLDKEGCSEATIRYKLDRMGTHAKYWWHELSLKNIETDETTHYVSYPPPDDYANGEVDNIRRVVESSTSELTFSNSEVYNYEDNIWQRQGNVGVLICAKPGKYVFTISDNFEDLISDSNHWVAYESPPVTIK
jgi:hypothetical protein